MSSLKSIALIVVASALVGLIVKSAHAADELNVVAGCNLDLNGDKVNDIAIVIESLGKKRLIVLIDKGRSIRATVLSEDVGSRELHCRHGAEIMETKAGRNKGKGFHTPGAYLELLQPEGSTVAYVWKNGKFEEVWTAD